MKRQETVEEKGRPGIAVTVGFGFVSGSRFTQEMGFTGSCRTICACSSTTHQKKYRRIFNRLFQLKYIPGVKKD
jgi:hypothetical protein